MFTLPRIRNKYAIFVGLSALILTLLVSSLGVKFKSESIPDIDTLYSKDYWIETIDAVGGENAYVLFSRYVADYTPTQQHGIAHIFGGALYTVTGNGGFAFCDDRYFNGCTHEYIAQALFENGFGFVSELNHTCILQHELKHVTACQHGIGHGMIAVLGYEVSSLKKALAACNDMELYPDLPRTIGCKGGVFMEYNMRDVAVGEGGAPRSPDTGVEFPCDELSDTDRLICLSWLPQWWENVFLDDSQKSNAFTFMGDYCIDVANNTQEREACITGISHQIAPNSNFDYELAGKKCENALAAPEDALICKLYVYRIIFYAANKIDGDYEEFCDGTTEKYKNFCVETIKNKFFVAGQENEVILSPLFFYDRELYNKRLKEIQESL